MDLIFLVLDTKSFYEFTIASGGKIALRNFHLGTQFLEMCVDCKECVCVCILYMYMKVAFV